MAGEAKQPVIKRGWVRWLPGDKVCHTALCDDVRANLRSRSWRYSSELPKAKQVCPLCTVLIAGSRSSLDGDPMVEFVRRKGWLRDYFSAPEPGAVLGSYPDRLPPEHLVDVSENTLSCFTTIMDLYKPFADGRDRQPGYFMRSGAVLGKTFNLQEMLQWVIVASLAFEISRSSAGGERGRELRRQQDKVVSSLRSTGALSLVRSVTAFCANFSGRTPFDQEEVKWCDSTTAGFLIHLRLCYTELVDIDKVTWLDFKEALTTAFDNKELSLNNVTVAGRAILRFCRGYPGGIPLLHVDEVVKVRRRTKSDEKEPPDGADLTEQPGVADGDEQDPGATDGNQQGRGGTDGVQQDPCAMDGSQQGRGGTDGNQQDHSGTDDDQPGFGTPIVPTLDDLCVEMCSDACTNLQALKGAVVYATMEYGIMKNESTRSGRLMCPALHLTFLDPQAFGRAVIAVLNPLFLGDAATAVDVAILVSGKPGEDGTFSPFITLLCDLLGGHPRLVGIFLEQLEREVTKLTDRKGARSRVIYASAIQAACWRSLEFALPSAGVGNSVAHFGGRDGLDTISSQAALGGLVDLETAAIKRMKDGVLKPCSWDELGGDGIVLLEDRPLKENRTKKQDQEQTPNWAKLRLHPVAALKIAFLGGSSVRYRAFQDMLMCPGSRLTGERLERVIANWCGFLSYVRADRHHQYSCVPLKAVWELPFATPRVGTGAVLNKVRVNASIARKSGVEVASLTTALQFAAKHPEEAVEVVFRLNSGAARKLQAAADLVEFFEVTQAFGRFKVGDLIAVVYQVKDCGVGRTGSPSLMDVNKAWELLECTTLTDAEMRDRWLDNVVFVYGNRYPGNYGTDLASKSRKEYDSGRAGRQSVLLGGSDLSGWLPDFVPYFIGVSQFLDMADVSREESLARLGTPPTEAVRRELEVD